MRTAVRIFISLWYLLGWIAHVYMGLFVSTAYNSFGDTALIPAYTTLWKDVVLPNITLFAFLLAVFELSVGSLLISRGKWVKIGLVLSILFNLFLVQMGLGWQVNSALSDFLVNRLPNLVFIAIQLPLLFWGWDERSIPEMILRRKSNKSPV